MRFNPVYAVYRGLTTLASPAVDFWLSRRMRKDKEDALRLRERFGYATIARPDSTLIWLHASSIGEAHSVLPLIETLRTRLPHHSVLFTTGTVSSVRVLTPKLPAGVVHQYIPVDTPQAVERFLAHWRPDFALFVESELWPNLLMETARYGVRMALVNARMSRRSFHTWRCMPWLIRPLLRCFEAVYAQTRADGARYEALGARVAYLGNLKVDAPALPVDAQALRAWIGQVGGRAVWLAASTHPGEEEQIALVHRALMAEHPNVLTVIAPRHPARGAAIAAMFRKQGFTVARRSLNEAAEGANIYLADTFGELGLFYRVCRIVFMGGSLVAHGGQNPLEPARIGCAILYGPHMFNFSEACQALEAAEAAVRVRDAATLLAYVASCLEDEAFARTLVARSQAWIAQQSGVRERVWDDLHARGWW